MDAVASLQATTTQHADLLESLAGHAIATSAEMTVLSARMGDVSRRVHDVSKRMDDVSKRMDDVSQRMDDVSQRMDDVSQRMDDVSQRMGGVSQATASLETRFQELAQDFVVSATLSRTIQHDVGRLARLLGEFAGRSSDRFETIEGRLDRLEKKTG